MKIEISPDYQYMVDDELPYAAIVASAHGMQNKGLMEKGNQRLGQNALCLRAFDVFVDTFQCLGQLGGIAADFYGDALDSISHTISPPYQNLSKSL